MATTALEQGTGAATKGERSLGDSLGEYGRGVAGGLIFSLPLLYTQEVWRAGVVFGPGRLAVGLAATFLLLIGYNRYAGLRSDAGPAEILIDSVEELGLGLLLAALILWLLGQLEGGMAPSALVGRILVAGLLTAIGVSVGTAQLGGDEADSGVEQDEEDGGLLSLIVLGVCGAVLIAMNVAPTEEVLLIAAEASGARLLGLVALALVLTAVVCFFSDFVGVRRGDDEPGAATILRETIITYGVALAVAAATLWFFQRLDAPAAAINRIVVLSVPATLGASAGRLLLQSAR